MSRTSASVLRPCCAARIRSARCTSSGKFRTVITGMMRLTTFAFNAVILTPCCHFNRMKIRSL
ncbi:hypothetical protein P355_0879 [Burkholderia cenocepacia KC-01]|nr:hypothetical protein P355_0879 [Burkholderia cenocepacia KC-01]